MWLSSARFRKETENKHCIFCPRVLLKHALELETLNCHKMTSAAFFCVQEFIFSWLY